MEVLLFGISCECLQYSNHRSNNSHSTQLKCGWTEFDIGRNSRLWSPKQAHYELTLNSSLYPTCVSRQSMHILARIPQTDDVGMIAIIWLMFDFGFIQIVNSVFFSSVKREQSCLQFLYSTTFLTSNLHTNVTLNEVRAQHSNTRLLHV